MSITEWPCYTNHLFKFGVLNYRSLVSLHLGEDVKLNLLQNSGVSLCFFPTNVNRFIYIYIYMDT